jgi:hypothetical protein
MIITNISGLLSSQLVPLSFSAHLVSTVSNGDARMIVCSKQVEQRLQVVDFYEQSWSSRIKRKAQ